MVNILGNKVAQNIVGKIFWAKGFFDIIDYAYGCVLSEYGH